MNKDKEITLIELFPPTEQQNFEGFLGRLKSILQKQKNDLKLSSKNSANSLSEVSFKLMFTAFVFQKETINILFEENRKNFQGNQDFASIEKGVKEFYSHLLVMSDDFINPFIESYYQKADESIDNAFEKLFKIVDQHEVKKIQNLQPELEKNLKVTATDNANYIDSDSSLEFFDIGTLKLKELDSKQRYKYTKMRHYTPPKDYKFPSTFQKGKVIKQRFASHNHLKDPKNSVFIILLTSTY